MRKEQKHLSIGINCTVVELKLQMSLVHYLMRLSINCTVVELKQNKKQGHGKSEWVLIVPLWN